MGRRVEGTVWLPPDEVRDRDLREALNRGATKKAQDILGTPPRGEYREWKGTEERRDGLSYPVLGDLCVWVDEAPGDARDGSGHFEVYSGAPEDYRPQIEAS